MKLSPMVLMFDKSFGLIMTAFLLSKKCQSPLFLVAWTEIEPTI